jgi:hypothetical protein
MNHHTIQQKFMDVSGQHTASMFRVKEQSDKEPTKKQDVSKKTALFTATTGRTSSPGFAFHLLFIGYMLCSSLTL